MNDVLYRVQWTPEAYDMLRLADASSWMCCVSFTGGSPDLSREPSWQVRLASLISYCDRGRDATEHAVSALSARVDSRLTALPAQPLPGSGYCVVGSVAGITAHVLRHAPTHRGATCIATRSRNSGQYRSWAIAVVAAADVRQAMERSIRDAYRHELDVLGRRRHDLARVRDWAYGALRSDTACMTVVAE